MFIRWLCVAVVFPHVATADVTTFGGDKKKKKKDEENFLPEAKPVNVRYITGIPVDIELNAATPSLGTVRFIIREQPQHGTLSAIRPHQRDAFKASVTYTPNPGDGALADRFTYACKLETGSWSAPAQVTLTGKRAEPKIEITGPPNFGKVLPGFEGSSKIVLKNSGIASFAADVQWQSPWIGPPRIELGIGEEKEYMLTVKPTAPGTLIWETEIQHGEPLSRLRLYVECVEPFMVAPGHLKLRFDSASGERRGKIGVANATDLPVKFTVEPPARLHAAKDIEVQPRQTRDLEVSLAPTDVAAFQGELWVISEPYRQRVVIEAPPTPPVAVLVSPKSAVIDFPATQKGRAAQAKIILQNTGGEPAVLAAQTAPPFRVSETDSAVSVAPGQTRELTIEATSEQAGRFNGSVIFSGTGGRLSIATTITFTDPNAPQPIRPSSAQTTKNLRAPVAKSATTMPAAAPNPAPAPVKPLTASLAATTPGSHDSSSAKGDPAKKDDGRPLSGAESALFAYLATWGVPIPKEQLSSKVTKIDAIEFVEQGRDHLVLAWKDTEPKPASYRLEGGYRVRNEATGRWLKAWGEMPGAQEIKGESGKHTMRINGLQPNSRYEMRVICLDDDGKVSEPSDIHFFSTAPPWHMPSWTWQALVIFALIVLIFIYVRMKSGKWDL